MANNKQSECVLHRFRQSMQLDSSLGRHQCRAADEVQLIVVINLFFHFPVLFISNNSTPK